MLTPTTADELAEIVRSTPRLLVVGAGTKSRLCETAETRVSTTKLSGIIEYDPGEFTFTALAGTPLREIIAALAARGQYLPFDPPFAESGATIGGTLAAGLSGAGRFRFGGLRDFVLAIRFADGEGRLMRGGAKVVKNAAGFDLPKFFCGSLGRYGAVVELTFKVFPRPASLLTLGVPCASAAEAAERMAAGAVSRWELDALEYQPSENRLLARLGGPAEANTALAADIAREWPGAAPLDGAVWRGIGEFEWAHAGGLLAKIPLTLTALPPLLDGLATLDSARCHVGAGGAVAYVSLASPALAPALSTLLTGAGLSALTLRGEGAPLHLGVTASPAVHEAVRRVFDPGGKFSV